MGTKYLFEYAQQQDKIEPSSARVVVDDGDEVVADVPLLLVRLRVLLVARHQGGHVKSHLRRI